MIKKSQADIAYEYIKNGVISKQFFPGNRLIEEEIVRDTGVSRTSVRTALTRLRYEGILEGTPNRGMSVTRFQPSDIKAVFHVRQALELGALELAIHNITPAVLERMRRRNEQLRHVTEKPDIADTAFHG